MNGQRKIAYFSMEIGLESGMPTYSGGLGVLAGDTIRAAADLKVPLVAVTLLYHKGYFYQRLDQNGWQTEEAVAWDVEDFLQEMPERVSVAIEGRQVQIRAWKYEVCGCMGFVVPVYFLDTDLPENADRDRLLTQSLYGGDQYHRLCQEVILGVGGVRMLRALGHNYLTRFHMNEGHASLLTLELLGLEAQKAGRSSVTRDDIEAVREQCIFTTHTPVPAGHDSFPARLVTRVLGCREDFIDMTDEVCAQVVNRVLGGNGEITTMPELLRSESPLNLTRLALNLSHYVNGVAKRHGEVSRQMFTGYAIDAITNGVHAASWVAEPFQQLYDNYLPGWRENSASLRYGLSIPAQELWQAHMQAKKELLRFANHETNAGLNVDVLTLGFARRSTPYKRADLFFHDIERLKRLAAEVGALQVVYAGKAHPHDQGGKELINHIFYLKEELKKDVRVVYLENYDMALGKLITGGVDIWLNTPQPPLEASGTSGMKAALNGVPSLSILDGWWIEGCIEGVTGWAIGGRNHTIGSGCDNAKDAASLYDKLEQTVLPLFYANRDGFIEVMRNAITLNGSFFTTHRMMQEYVLKAYFS